MQTIEQVESPAIRVDDDLRKLRTRNRWLSWLAAILAVAVIALGAWLIFNGDDGTKEADLTAEQEQMLETINGYLDALNDHDGAAAAAFMSSQTSYHDNGGARFHVRDGELEAYFDSLGRSFSVRSLVNDGEAAFVGDVVMTTDFIPDTSTRARPSIFKMTPDGTGIVWHHAP